jgi:hypothetical protein
MSKVKDKAIISLKIKLLVKDRQTNVEGVIRSMGSQLQPSLLDNEIAIATFPS